jgi:hypothetical protein
VGSHNARTHVNIYCDGVRVLSSGYDPIAGNNFPQLIQSGEVAGENIIPPPNYDSLGDMWKVAIVTTQITAGVLTCNVQTTQSTAPDLPRDGSTAYCVDNEGLNGANSQVLLTSSGEEPANANALCYH